MLTHKLKSEFLSLHPIGLDDVESLHVIWTDEEVRRFLWDGEVIPLEQTRQIVMKNQELSSQSGFGIWGICDRSSQTSPPHTSNSLIGFAGFWHFRTPPTLELLFGVTPEHWGHGIATEASHRIIRYGFEDLGFNVVEASTDFENKGSIRVLEKLGFSFQKREVVDGLDTLFYQKIRP